MRRTTAVYTVFLFIFNVFLRQEKKGVE